MSISTIRRQVKNVAYNFSDAQVKVREATSNDPWGPSTGLMSEIADLTHNPLSFTEIMSMLWKRLNDHGKNWRHVYKSLVLLEYLIKCGSEKVAQQCRENIYSIETLKDFQHVEDNRDQGMNVRQKAKQMVALLYDEERLKNERAKSMLTRRKFLSGSAVSSNGVLRHSRKGDSGPILDPELEKALPSDAGEEEIQLQLAIALSKEESEKEEELRKSYDVGLQMAINESKKEAERISALEKAPQQVVSGSTLSQSAIDDLLSLGVGQPVESNAWGTSTVDPWAPSPSVAPAANLVSQQAPVNDPWLPASSALTNTPNNLSDPWSATSAKQAEQEPAPLLQSSRDESSTKQRTNVKTPESFLGENSNLVNLDNLMGTTSSSSRPASNPFLSSTGPNVSTNPFAAQQRPSPSLNEMMSKSHGASMISTTSAPIVTPTLSELPSTSSSQQQQTTNPFLL